jgi:hypothetical protein
MPPVLPLIQARLARRSVLPALLLALACPAAAQSSWTFDGTLQHTGEWDPFWGLAQALSPEAGYDDQYDWTEAYVRGSWRWTSAAEQALRWRAGASVIATATAGTDLFLEGDSARLGFDEAYVGLRHQGAADGAAVDFSIGRQNWFLGEKLLLSVGAGNGFERGAAILAPRKAWDMTAVLDVSRGAWSGGAFYLDPDELPSSDSGTRLVGVRLGWTPDATLSLGAAWFEVLESETPYPQAPILIIENGRDGLKTFDVHGRWQQASGAWSVSGELAWQRNGRIELRAFGGAVETAYRFVEHRWMPRLAYSLRYFSGDDPDTPGRLERFDSLYYDGSPGTWSSGGNGSFAFYNSNLVVHRLSAEAVITPSNFVKLYYWHVNVAELDSPVQYGQAARPGITEDGIVIISGFPNRGLSNELYVEHTHVFSEHWFLTWGVGVSKPRSGLKAVVASEVDSWPGAYANLTFRY